MAGIKRKSHSSIKERTCPQKTFTGRQVSATTRDEPDDTIVWVVGGETNTSAPSSSKKVFHIG
jgi:hypothetical protein